MWINAFRFSMHVLKKNHFKLMIPAFFLGIFMLFIYTTVSYWFLVYANIVCPEPYDTVSILIVFLIIFIVTFFLYISIYPLLRTYVLYVGWTIKNGKTDTAYHDFRLVWKNQGMGKRIRVISMKRFLFQTISFVLLCTLPVLMLLAHWKLSSFDTPYSSGTYILLHLFTILSFIPTIIGYSKFFFSELNLIQFLFKMNVTTTQKEKTDVSTKYTKINNHRTSKFVLIWKIFLTTSYLVIVILLVLILLHLTHSNISNYPFMKYFTDVFQNGFFGFLLYGSKIFFVNFLFVPFFFQNLPSPNGTFLGVQWGEIFSFQVFPVQLLFIILLGLLTAFFFLIETLSAVYFYQPHNNSEIVN